MLFGAFAVLGLTLAAVGLDSVVWTVLSRIPSCSGQVNSAYALRSERVAAMCCA